MTGSTRIGPVVWLLCSAVGVAWPVCLSAAEEPAGPTADSAAAGRGGGQWTVVASFPIPESASGLAFDGTNLYCGIYGSNGGNIYQIDPTTGAYSLAFTGPQGDAYGLTYDGRYLWTTDHPGSSSVPAVAMRLNWSGGVITQFNLPDHYMSGIAYDNGDYWVARYYPDPSHIYKVADSGAILDQFAAPDNQPWDLCLENGNLWMADYWGDTLYKIDASSGALLDSHASEGVDPAGIVYDGQFLWYCDNGTVSGQDTLYKVDLAGGGTPAILIPVTSHDYGTISIGNTVAWNMTVQNTGSADLNISGVSFNPTDDLSTTTGFPLVIPPAGNSQIAIVYSPDDFNPLDATVTVSSNDPINPQEQATVTGYGVYPDPTLGLAQSAHDYGPVRAGAHTRWFEEITNQGNSLLTVSDIVSDDPAFYIDGGVSLPINLPTLASVDVGVWFNPETAVAYSGTVTITSNDPGRSPDLVPLSGSGVETQYPMSQSLWSYLIDVDYDNSPKAMAPISDISGDGIADVIVCSEDDYVRCFNGNAHGTGDVLWEHEIYAGSVYQASGLQITQDVNGDGYEDVVVASAWGGRVSRAISGQTGPTARTHDTRTYGDGGWVYAVDCSYDYNSDGVVDVLAVAGDDSTDTGPKRVYCLNGLTGVSIWERPLGGPGFGVLGVEDFTGDGQPDVVAGASTEDQTQGRVIGINGPRALIQCRFLPNGTSAQAIEQIDRRPPHRVRDRM
ncbi:MAG: choice-of-anchor D domain-containing protein, partial [bacterium]|nr:choice-of-anchor D domain-containing protein [bacterium]